MLNPTERARLDELIALGSADAVRVAVTTSRPFDPNVNSGLVLLRLANERPDLVRGLDLDVAIEKAGGVTDRPCRCYRCTGRTPRRGRR